MKKLYFEKKKRIKEILYITLGVAIASFAFSFFLNPNNLVIGGVSGIGIIIKDLFSFDPALIILLINVFLLIISLFLLGKEFFIKTLYGSLTFPLFTALFDFIYELINKYTTNFDFSKLDPMLVTLFSSIIMGYGLGLSLKHGASTGGTEIVQKTFFKYFHIPYSLTLYMVDGLVIFIGFFVMKQSIDTLLFELIFVLLSGFVMDTVIFSGFNKRAVYIISDHCEEIKDRILKSFERGVSSIKVVGEYSKQDKKMLMCVLSSSEYYKLRDCIEKIDSKAFFYAVRANEVRGEGFSYDSE